MAEFALISFHFISKAKTKHLLLIYACDMPVQSSGHPLCVCSFDTLSAKILGSMSFIWNCFFSLPFSRTHFFSVCKISHRLISDLHAENSKGANEARKRKINRRQNKNHKWNSDAVVEMKTDYIELYRSTISVSLRSVMFSQWQFYEHKHTHLCNTVFQSNLNVETEKKKCKGEGRNEQASENEQKRTRERACTTLTMCFAVAALCCVVLWAWVCVIIFDRSWERNLTTCMNFFVHSLHRYVCSACEHWA